MMPSLLSMTAKGQVVRNDTVTDRTHQLQEVTVTETRRQHEVTSTAPLHILDRGEMLTLGVTDVADALHRIPGVTLRDYIREWFDAHPKARREEQQAFLSSRRNINFLFNRVTDEKLAMDARLYTSLMVRLLVGDPQHPEISPYFKLTYDNVFARIYAVL